MGLFNKSKEEKLIKFFKEKKISYNEHDGLIELSLNFSNNKYFLHPYLKIENDDIYITINLRRCNKKDNLYDNINNFNLLSKFFKAIIKNDLLFLSYNAYYSGDNEQILEILNSLYSLENEIDNL